MDIDFDYWEEKLLNTPDSQYINTPEVRPNIYEYVGSTRVGVYAGDSDSLFAGLWLQTSDRKVRIYSHNEETGPQKETLYMVSFDAEKVRNPLHRHNAIEMGYVVKGPALQEFSGKEITFQTGDFWITDRNCYHSDILFSGDVFTVYITIPQRFFDDIFMGSVGDSQIQHFMYTALMDQKKTLQFLHFTPRNHENYTRQIMQQIFNELTSEKIGFMDIVKGLMVRLLYILSMEFDFSLTNQQKSKMHELLYQEIESYIRTNYQTVTIRKLVNEFHYNEDFYNRLFKQYSGLTYSEYLQRVRLSQAKSLLKNTKLPIEDIAYKVGYRSKSYFYRIFAQDCNMTPLQFRKSNTNPTKTNNGL